MLVAAQAQGADAPWSRHDLVVTRVDHLARVTPDALYAEYPLSPSTYDRGFRKVDYRHFANAIDGLAWWLHETLGPAKHFEPLAYIGPNDLRYPALILGAVKAGYVLFVTSPRNSLAAQISLLDSLACKVMLSPDPRPAPIEAILAGHDMRVLQVPSVDDLLDKRYPHFPFTRTLAEASSDPLVIVHTSGSTGIPKPLVYTHAFGAANMAQNSLAPPSGFQSQERWYQAKRLFMTFPPFHGASLVTLLFNAIPHGTVIIAPTSAAIPSAEGLVEGLKRTPADIAFIVPSIVQELSQNPALLDYVAQNLEMIIYCGGDLPQATGDLIASKIKLVNQYGASEMGLVACLQSAGGQHPEDWKYCHFHPRIGAELRHATGDVYEYYVVRDPELAAQQPVFNIFPELDAYPSRDLFVRHPSNDKLWKWVARADDVIVFLNGEKTNPITMEQHVLARNPDIAAVLVAGAQRFQAALLIEPKPCEGELTASERAAFIEKIWPTIEEANRDCPAHAKIAKSHILFTSPQRPMLRAGKGTIQRSGTMRMYAKELDALYADADTIAGGTDDKIVAHPVNLDDMDLVVQTLRRSISSVTNWPNFQDDDNFFALGMDSLQALMTVRNLRQALAMPTIALSTVYTNPSISALATVIQRLSGQDDASHTLSEQAQIQEMSDMLKEYQVMINRIPIPSNKAPGETNGQTIVLTGSTGALGSYVLDTLLADPAVAHVYCLNRSSDALSLQVSRNKARSLSTPLPSARATFLTANLSEPNFGLPAEAYNRLLSTATTVIHAAWPVNFNLPLRSFRPSLQGIVNLVAFAAEAPALPHLLFVSSISSVLAYRTPSHLTPEDVIVDPAAPARLGYARSKHVAERLLAHACSRFPLRTCVARVGQIGGAVRGPGIWNPAEWFPSLVISSLHVGAVPGQLGSMDRIDWVPIDLLSEILVEAGAKNGSPDLIEGVGHMRVLHPVNPRVTSWDRVRPVVVDELSSIAAARMGSTKSINVVPLADWIVMVRKDIEATAGSKNALMDGELEAFLRVNPAVKLLDFYEEVLGTKDDENNVLETKRTEMASRRLRELDAVNETWIRKWIGEWIPS